MLVAGAIFPLIAVVLMTALLAAQMYERANEVAWAEHSDEVLQSAEESQLDLMRMSSQVRDYLIRDDPGAKRSYHEEQDRASASLSALALLVSDNPVQVARVNALSQL